MKAEKILLGSLAIVISALGSGCAAVTPAAEYGSSLPPSPGAQGVAVWAPERPTHITESPSHFSNRSSHASFRSTKVSSR